MAVRLEIALREDLFDAEGASLARKARDYFGYEVAGARAVRVLTIDAELPRETLEQLRREIFTNPVTEVSSFTPLAYDADWVVWVGYLPGVKDAAGETAREAIEDFLGRPLAPGEACYTSKLFFLRTRPESGAGRGASGGASLRASDLDRIARELLSNDLIQRYRIWRIGGHDIHGGVDAPPWDATAGIGLVIPKVDLHHRPRVTEIPIGSDEELLRISAERHLFLDPRDAPAIRQYYLRGDVREARRKVGLDLPTDVELEYIAQARSDHCNHNTFRGLFRYRDRVTGESATIDSLFHTFIEAPTLAIAEKKAWVVSVLWDNAGVGRFDENHYYTITGETHNSPSNMEAYGGSITGIVGVYRDPLGTGKGSKLICGTYGYCVGPRDYTGRLRPRLHPRRLLDGVVEGVRDGGNKSGIPTVFGQVFFDECYLGKCLVFVSAFGIMPAIVSGESSDKKRTRAGDLVVMCGGRVGKDGIHGVTASSHIYSEHTPAGHVQIGDPYTQKKMHDFLIEARDQGLIQFITDCGGGGLSSAVGESARFSGGAEVDLDRIPLKYDGLDQWEIWISESQERMTVAVDPSKIEAFLDLSRRHAVESTVIGRYTDSGYVQLKYQEQTCAHIALDFFKSDFPQWEFDADWVPPEARGLFEPVLSEPADHHACLLAMLARPNIASREWVQRQYDHEVQGGSVIKPLIGVNQDVPSDAAVLRPVLSSMRGLAIAQAVNPTYSKIDAHAMTAVTIDEAVRRVIAVGGDPAHIGGVDNFCWPEIRFHSEQNPDGKLKAAQLVRSCLALKSSCMAMGIPLLSGKDSMYIDGSLAGPFGERHRVSGLPTLQFTTISLVPDVRSCLTLEPKRAGDLVYMLGVTRNELGGSEYYEMFGQTGLCVPTVDAHEVFPMYRALAAAIRDGCVASAHGVYRGGLGVHLAWLAIAGGLGLEIGLARVACVARRDETRASSATGPHVHELIVLRNDTALYSESAGRLLVTVPPDCADRFEKRMAGHAMAPIGQVIAEPRLRIRGVSEEPLIDLPIPALWVAWKLPFGHLI
jgi:phosphoribosylformylglycinamidine synthase